MNHWGQNPVIGMLCSRMKDLCGDSVSSMNGNAPQGQPKDLLGDFQHGRRWMSIRADELYDTSCDEFVLIAGQKDHKPSKRINQPVGPIVLKNDSKYLESPGRIGPSTVHCSPHRSKRKNLSRQLFEISPDAKYSIAKPNSRLDGPNLRMYPHNNSERNKLVVQDVSKHQAKLTVRDYNSNTKQAADLNHDNGNPKDCYKDLEQSSTSGSFTLVSDRTDVGTELPPGEKPCSADSRHPSLNSQPVAMDREVDPVTNAEVSFLWGMACALLYPSNIIIWEHSFQLRD